jgi:hypothetical protein
MARPIAARPAKPRAAIGRTENERWLWSRLPHWPEQPEYPGEFGAMAAVGAPTGAAQSRLPRALLSALRAEDLLILAWVGLANPLLARAQGGGDLFSSGRPIQGSLQLVGAVGAVVCLCTRTAGVPAASQRSITDGGAIGPAVGGLMLVGGSAFAGLGLSPGAALLLFFGLALFGPLFQNMLPALTTTVRRALITPFVLAAAGIFWSFVRGITGGAGLFRDPGSLVAEAPTIAPLLGILTLAAAVYYAMLVFAPRQIAEPEGSLPVWLVRFGLFMAGLLLGFGWLGVLGT